MDRRTLLSALPAFAAVMTQQQHPGTSESFEVAVARRGSWDSSVAELGMRAGFFARHRITLDILYTKDSSETLQTVLARRADIGVGVATVAAIGAYASGAPVRIIRNETTGMGDLFWYVRCDSPIRSVGEVGGQRIAYAPNSVFSNAAALAFAATFGPAANLVVTGGLLTTYTQVMSGNVDVGWSSAPHLLDQVEAGRIRIIGTANDVPDIRNQTVRVQVAHAALPGARHDALDRFMRGYRDTVQWMYASAEAPRAFAELTGMPEAVAQRLRTEFFPRSAIWPDTVSGVDGVMAGAVRSNYLAVPLCPRELEQLIRIPRH